MKKLALFALTLSFILAVLVTSFTTHFDICVVELNELGVKISQCGFEQKPTPLPLFIVVGIVCLWMYVSKRG